MPKSIGGLYRAATEGVFSPLVPAKAGIQAFLLETRRLRIKNLGPRLRGDERIL